MTTDFWYPGADEYWVRAIDADAYPLRYGDVFATPELAVCRSASGKPWSHVVVLHPSCELGAKAADDTEALVARVNAVTHIGANQRAAVRVGWTERGGSLRVAHANTFWMPPLPGQRDDIDWYADFRRAQRVPLSHLREAGRSAAMTHEARLYLIRRELYFRYRWLVDIEAVRDNEAERITGDTQFAGPRPSWAPAAR